MTDNKQTAPARKAAKRSVDKKEAEKEKVFGPKEAVRTAYEYLTNVSPSSDSFSNFRIEEILMDKKNFTITLSYDVAGEFGFDKKREYKEFDIDKNSGQVVAMKIKRI